MAVDYATLKRWWEAHDWKPLPRDCLPSIGSIAGGICAGFLYRTDSKLALIEYIISDPSSSKKDRKEAVRLVIEDLTDKATDLGYIAIYTSTTSPSLINHYKNVGFKVTDTNITSLVRSI